MMYQNNVGINNNWYHAEGFLPFCVRDRAESPQVR